MTKLLTRKSVSQHLGVTPRHIDRLRQNGRLPWIDLSAGMGKRPCVRFKLADIEAFEQRFRQDVSSPSK